MITVFLYLVEFYSTPPLKYKLIIIHLQEEWASKMENLRHEVTREKDREFERIKSKIIEKHDEELRRMLEKSSSTNQGMASCENAMT